MDFSNISNERKENMDLNSISNKYKINLEKFFNNDDVIEIIYRKQYGDEYYEANENECKQNFKEIMKNTVFVPYITMEHLEGFLVSIREEHGDQYLADNYGEELNLLKKLQNEKKTIIKNYSSFMLDELKQFCPNLEKDKYNKILENFSNSLSEVKEYCYNLEEDKYNKIVKKFSNSLAELKRVYPKSEKNEYNKIFENFSNSLDELKQFCPVYKEDDYNKILENFSNSLNEVIQFYSNFEKDNYNKIVENFSNTSFEDNVSKIQSLLSENKNGFFQKLKRKKIEKCIEKYKKLAEDKITAATSSYYKHISDIPNGKNYANILEEIQAGDSCVLQKVGKKSDRNMRYIFLPVLTYKNKEQYLTFALHEVMHLSKEKIQKNKYKTGILESTIAKNPTKYFMFWNIPSSDLAFEEIANDWQAREAMLELQKNPNLLASFEMTYDAETRGPYGHYESFDNYTKPFMEQFGNEIQEINCGKLSAKKFKKNLGKTNFNTFSEEANNTITYSEAHPIDTTILSNKFHLPENLEADIALLNMIECSNIAQAKAEKRAAFLEKARAIMNIDILAKLKEYDEYFANKTKNQHQNIHYPEAR